MPESRSEISSITHDTPKPPGSRSHVARADMTDEQRQRANQKNYRRRKRMAHRRRLLEQGIEAGDPAVIRKATSKFLAAQLRSERMRAWAIAEELQAMRDDLTTNHQETT